MKVTEIEKREKPSGRWHPPGTSGGYAYPGWWEKDEREVKTRLYVHPGETLLENPTIGRFTRPHEEYRKVLPAVFAELGIEPVKAHWSQRAGCSCGCSPAFILDARLGYDVFVTVEQEPVELTEDEKRLRDVRLAQVVGDPTIPVEVLATTRL